MAFNGSGLFARLYNWVTDAANLVNIDPARMDAETDGIATGLSNTICRDGQSTISADIPWNGKKITGLGDASAATDALNRQSGDARFLPFVVSKSADYTLLITDIGAYIKYTGTFTLTLLAAATATSRFRFWVKNTGTGILTIDPNGVETIDGFATMLIWPGQECMVYCDGSNWFTHGKSNVVYDQTLVSAASLFPVDVDLQLCNFNDFEYHLTVIPNSATADFGVFGRTSSDAVSFDAGASDYSIQQLVGIGATPTAAAAATTGANIGGNIESSVPTPTIIKGVLFRGSSTVRPAGSSLFGGVETSPSAQAGATYFMRNSTYAMKKFRVAASVVNALQIGTRLVVRGV